MDGWTTMANRPGYISKTITHGTATVVIYRPIHNEAEAAKAKEKARTALANALRGIR